VIAERSAILLALVIKLYRNQTDHGDETEGLEREGLKMERLEREGEKRLFIVKSKTKEKCRFKVPSAVALLNYISSVILWRIFAKLEFSRGILYNKQLNYKKRRIRGRI
jgi:hypothetical protein